MKTISDFLEQFRISSKPLQWKLDRRGRDELEMFVSEERRQAKKEFVATLFESGLINLSKLDPREGKIIKMRFGELKTLEEVGMEFGVTRERIRSLEIKAIEKLKEVPDFSTTINKQMQRVIDAIPDDLIEEVEVGNGLKRTKVWTGQKLKEYLSGKFFNEW